jgi:hypothetical protein
MLDPWQPDISCIDTPSLKHAPRSVYSQFDNRPISMKFDQPSAIESPQETGTARMHQRTVAAATE